MTTNLDQLLNFDALNEAEKITGKSYKTNKGTSILGLALLQENAQHKKEQLQSLDDTYDHIPLSEYIEIVENFGFKCIYTEMFDSHHQWDKDCYYIYYHDDLGILLSFDTYYGLESINSGSFYYNVGIDKECVDYYKVTESGSCYDSQHLTQFKHVWVGYHDAREATIYNIQRLQKVGQFLQPWIYSQHVWLHHYRDDPDRLNNQMSWSDKMRIMDVIQEKRIKKLPEYVRKNCLLGV